MSSSRSTARFCPTCKQSIVYRSGLNISDEINQFLRDITPSITFYVGALAIVHTEVVSGLDGWFYGTLWILGFLASVATLGTSIMSSYAKSFRKMKGKGLVRVAQILYLSVSCVMIFSIVSYSTAYAWKKHINSESTTQGPDSVESHTPTKLTDDDSTSEKVSLMR